MANGTAVGLCVGNDSVTRRAAIHTAGLTSVPTALVQDYHYAGYNIQVDSDNRRQTRVYHGLRDETGVKAGRIAVRAECATHLPDAGVLPARRRHLVDDDDGDGEDGRHRHHPAEAVGPQRERIVAVAALLVVEPREHHDELQTTRIP